MPGSTEASCDSATTVRSARRTTVRAWCRAPPPDGRPAGRTRAAAAARLVRVDRLLEPRDCAAVTAALARRGATCGRVGEMCADREQVLLDAAEQAREAGVRVAPPRPRSSRSPRPRRRRPRRAARASARARRRGAPSGPCRPSSCRSSRRGPRLVEGQRRPGPGAARRRARSRLASGCGGRSPSRWAEPRRHRRRSSTPASLPSAVSTAPALAGRARIRPRSAG